DHELHEDDPDQRTAQADVLSLIDGHHPQPENQLARSELVQPNCDGSQQDKSHGDRDGPYPRVQERLRSECERDHDPSDAVGDEEVDTPRADTPADPGDRSRSVLRQSHAYAWILIRSGVAARFRSRHPSPSRSSHTVRISGASTGPSAAAAGKL